MQDYINKDCFVTVEKHEPSIPGCGNGWLQTGVAHALGLCDPPLIKTVTACYDWDGRFWRSPHKNNPGDETKCDDYWGILILIPQQWCEIILKSAESNEWDFDIGKQTRLDYRFDRFPAFPPFLRLCAGKSLTLYDHAILIVTAIKDCFSMSHADGNMRAFCRIHGLAIHTPYGELIKLFWEWKAKRKFGNVGGAFSKYFGKDHPVSKA